MSQRSLQNPDQADFMNRVTRDSSIATLSQRVMLHKVLVGLVKADFHDGDKSKSGQMFTDSFRRGYDVMSMDEYIQTFNDISAAPESIDALLPMYNPLLPSL